MIKGERTFFIFNGKYSFYTQAIKDRKQQLPYHVKIDTINPAFCFEYWRPGLGSTMFVVRRKDYNDP